jgi:predicted nucleotide-binding protein
VSRVRSPGGPPKESTTYRRGFQARADFFATRLQPVLTKYRSALEDLENLSDLVDSRSRTTDGVDAEKLDREICELYGQVAHVYQEVISREKVRLTRGKNSPTYPNYFEAAYLSGSTEYLIEGRSELLKAIGAVKALVLRGLREPEKTETKTKQPHIVGQRVFLVHGHDEAALQSVARFIERLKLPLTVLREEPNRGQTVIEKFEAHAGDAGFAIVLITGDDVGGKRGTPAEQLQPRARQNVILELGYFNGKLGRDRVCALYEAGVELPSDYGGVTLVELDKAGSWRLQLARELKAALLNVDMNDAV